LGNIIRGIVQVTELENAHALDGLVRLWNTVAHGGPNDSRIVRDDATGVDGNLSEELSPPVRISDHVSFGKMDSSHAQIGGTLEHLLFAVHRRAVLDAKGFFLLHPDADRVLIIAGAHNLSDLPLILSRNHPLSMDSVWRPGQEPSLAGAQHNFSAPRAGPTDGRTAIIAIEPLRELVAAYPPGNPGGIFGGYDAGTPSSQGIEEHRDWRGWLFGVPAAVDVEERWAARFYVNRSDVTSSLAPAGKGNWAGVGAEVREMRVVPTLRLDRIIASVPPGVRIDLKLDCQGRDFAALRSAGAALKRVNAIQLELIVKSDAYDGQAPPENFARLLQAHGFEPQGVFERSPNGEQMDVFFKHSRLLLSE
jgi:hypothetical protein